MTRSALFTKLAEGLPPTRVGRVASHDFSRALTENDQPFYRSFTLKIAGSPVFVPAQIAQFGEAVQIAMAAHARNPDFDYNQSRATIYVRQSLLKPGQYSVSGGVHMDTVPNKALDGTQEKNDIYLISDQSALTTLYYPDPIHLDPDYLAHIPQAAHPTLLFRWLNHSIEGMKPVQGAAYEVMQGSELHVHEAQTPQKMPEKRTFVSIMCYRDTEKVISGNDALLQWQFNNRPEDFAFQVRAGIVSRDLKF